MINFRKLEKIAFSLLEKHRGNMRSFHVAAIYKKSKLISIGINKDVTHPKVHKYKYHRLAKVHAELSSVIKGGKKDYENHTIAILRINRNDKIDYSCPCNGCTDMIKQLGFSKVYHTLNDGTWAELDVWNAYVESDPQRF